MQECFDVSYNYVISWVFLGGSFRCLQVKSSKMTCFFKSICVRIAQKIPATSFASDILNEKGMFSVLSDIESLANTVNVILDKDGYQMTKDFKPGEVIGLEVEVAFDNGELQVLEKVLCICVYSWNTYIKILVEALVA